MSTSSLVAHCGARIVEREELGKVPLPPATSTWYPVSHLHVVEKVETALQQSGFVVEREQFALTRNDARFFGTIDLRSPIVPGVSMAVGIRNSNDKSLPLAFAAGSRVFVCDNLAFNSEIVIARKHTRFGDQRFTEAVARAVQSLQQFQQAEGKRISRFQGTEISNIEAESLMLRSYERGIVSHRLLPRLIEEWRNPGFAEFQPRTLWSLFNAHTAVLADRQKSNPQEFAHLTIQLSDLLSAAAHLPLLEAQPAPPA